MGDGLNEIEVQWMVCNTFKKWIESGQELKNITIKFLLSTMRPLRAMRLIDCYNQLTSSHGK